MPAVDWTTVRQLVEAARQIPNADRLEFLRKECGSQKALLDEVLSLLGQEDRAESFLEPPPAGEVAPLLRQHQAAGYVGKTIGDFEITGLLGYGGMGLVLRARQSNPPREVALKIVRGGSFVDKRQLRLFEREIRSLARLSHQGIASLYEAGCTDDGQHYFAMELVEGEPITTFSRNNDLSVARRLALFEQLCQAIHYAHQRGVIHRDLKPSNVLITPHGQVKVLDFGLAKITDSDLSATSIAGLGGKVEGTVAYMSPEQARGAGEEIDVRSDVYSLGVVLYELLTHRLPYEAGAPLPEMIRQVSDEPPIRPSTVMRVLRGDLETIILKAMEKEPQRRYQSADALAEDIERFLNQQPIAARPPSAIYQLRKFATRHRLPVAFASLLILLVTISAVVGSMLSFRLARERDAALAAKQSATQARESAEQVSDFLVKLFEQGNPWVSEGSNRTVQDVVKAGVERVQTELHGQPLVQARLMTSLGLVYSTLQEFDRAQELLEAGLAIRERELGPHHMDVVDSLFSINKFFQGKGEHDRAHVLAQRAIEICRDHHPENLSRYADMLEMLGENRFYAGQLEAATDYYRRCLDLRLKLYGEEHMEVASALQNLGVTLNAAKQLDEAESMLRRAEALKRKLNAPPESMIWLFDALAHIPFARGDYVETERLLKEQVEYAKTNLHKGHPWVVGSLNHYATVVLDNHGPARAEPICREALAVARENGGNVVPPLRALAHVRRKLKDYEEARKLYSEALAIRRQRNGNKHASVAESARELGMVLYEAHRFEEAEASLQESFAIYSSTLGLENTTTSSVAKDITNLYEDWNRPEDASIWREKSTATTNGKSIQLGG